MICHTKAMTTLVEYVFLWEY